MNSINLLLLVLVHEVSHFLGHSRKHHEGHCSSGFDSADITVRPTWNFFNSSYKVNINRIEVSQQYIPRIWKMRCLVLFPLGGCKHDFLLFWFADAESWFGNVVGQKHEACKIWKWKNVGKDHSALWEEVEDIYPGEAQGLFSEKNARSCGWNWWSVRSLRFFFEQKSIEWSSRGLGSFWHFMALPQWPPPSDMA